MLFEYDLINEVTDGLHTRNITDQKRENRAPSFIYLFCVYLDDV